MLRNICIETAAHQTKQNKSRGQCTVWNNIRVCTVNVQLCQVLNCRVFNFKSRKNYQQSVITFLEMFISHLDHKQREGFVIHMILFPETILPIYR